jgi:hypothetical protein
MAIAIAWVAAVLIGMLAANEPLRGMFDGTLTFTWLGYLVFGTLLVAAVLGVRLTVQARRADPPFRGALSETVRLLAIAETVLMFMAWMFYLFR